MDRHEEILHLLTTEILQASEALTQGDLLEDELPSASDLARKLNLKLEMVKKKLRILKGEGLIHPISFSPKRYRIDRYGVNHLSPEHPLYAVIFAETTSDYVQ